MGAASWASSGGCFLFKEDRRSSSCDRPVYVEQTSRHSPYPDEDSPDSQSCNLSGRMDSVYRYQESYLHAPMSQSVRKFLRFCVTKKTYQFTCLLFGLATLSREFPKPLRAVVQLPRLQAVRLHVYLDDWLIRADSPQVAMSAVSHQRTATSGLDYKFQEVRTQASWGIRFHWDASQDVGFHSSTPAKDVDQNSIHHQPLAPGRHGVSTGPSQDAGHYSIYGNIGSQGMSQVPTYPLLGQWSMGPDNSRLGSRGLPCQIGSLHSSSGLVGVSSSVPGNLSQDLRHWFHVVHRRIHPWMGAQLGNHSISGQWSKAQCQNHINIMEMKAVYCAVRGFLNKLHGKVVHLMCDNTTVVSYIEQEGGA